MSLARAFINKRREIGSKHAIKLALEFVCSAVFRKIRVIYILLYSIPAQIDYYFNPNALKQSNIAPFVDNDRIRKEFIYHGFEVEDYEINKADFAQWLNEVNFTKEYSDAYGEAFTDWKDPLDTANYPSRAFKDLIESIDYIASKYDFIDPNRFGVTGCSAGGYLTNWIITHSNRFKAAVTVASISNWYSMYGCSDNGPCSTIARDLSNGKEPWNAPDAYLSASPISHVAKVQTPLLIIHGENDLRCPIEQAEQLFAALKKQGKTVKFIRFPGEPHVNIHTMKKPSHTREALNMTIEWFDKYLK